MGKETIPFINVKTWKELTNLGGVRIEDTIVITSKGHKNLSKVPEEMGYLLYMLYYMPSNKPKVKRRLGKRRLGKRRLSKRRLSKRRLSKRRLSKRRLSKRRLSKRRLSKRRLSKRRSKMKTIYGGASCTDNDKSPVKTDNGDCINMDRDNYELKVHFNKETGPIAVNKESWQKDGDARVCSECREEFSMTRRRHHCRVCGKVFCSTCAEGIMEVLNTVTNKMEVVRACKKCVKDSVTKMNDVSGDDYLIDHDNLQRLVLMYPDSNTFGKWTKNLEGNNWIWQHGTITLPAESIELIIRCAKIYKKDCVDQIGQGTFGVVHSLPDSNLVFKRYKEPARIASNPRLLQETMQELWDELNIFLRIRSKFENSMETIYRYMAIPICIVLSNTGLPVQIQEHVGTSLNDYLEINDPTEDECLLMAIDIATGMDYLHTARVLHLDLKPANIALKYNESTHENECRLMDFGLSQSLDERVRYACRGTPQYTAPEMIIRNHKLLERNIKVKQIIPDQFNPEIVVCSLLLPSLLLEPGNYYYDIRGKEILDSDKVRSVSNRSRYFIKFDKSYKGKLTLDDLKGYLIRMFEESYDFYNNKCCFTEDCPYTVKMDVYSYGCVLLDIMNIGPKKYTENRDGSSTNVKHMARWSQKVNAANKVHPKVYEVMLQCIQWPNEDITNASNPSIEHLIPNQRPSFSEIITSLRR